MFEEIHGKSCIHFLCIKIELREQEYSEKRKNKMCVVLTVCVNYAAFSHVITVVSRIGRDYDLCYRAMRPPRYRAKRYSPLHCTTTSVSRTDC